MAPSAALVAPATRVTAALATSPAGAAAALATPAARLAAAKVAATLATSIGLATSATLATSTGLATAKTSLAPTACSGLAATMITRVKSPTVALPTGEGLAAIAPVKPATGITTVDIAPAPVIVVPPAAVAATLVAIHAARAVLVAIILATVAEAPAPIARHVLRKAAAVRPNVEPGLRPYVAHRYWVEVIGVVTVDVGHRYPLRAIKDEIRAIVNVIVPINLRDVVVLRALRHSRTPSG